MRLPYNGSPKEAGHKMKKPFATRYLPLDIDVVLLLIRLVVGSAFIIHGSGKIQHPFNWMGPNSHVPAIFQLLAALSEFGGGIAVVLGLIARLAAFGIGCTMLVAVYTHRIILGDPFVNLTGGRSYEPALGYLLFALLLLVIGPGRFSLDRKIFGTR
jgi:putative oxidoreductase